jgi:hypothetical protein
MSVGHARTASRQEVTSKDDGLIPDGPAGNPITLMGAGCTADPPVASERQGAEEAGLRGGSAASEARNPDEQAGQTALMQNRPARWFLF